MKHPSNHNRIFSLIGLWHFLGSQTFPCCSRIMLFNVKSGFWVSIATSLKDWSVNFKWLSLMLNINPSDAFFLKIIANRWALLPLMCLKRCDGYSSENGSPHITLNPPRWFFGSLWWVAGTFGQRPGNFIPPTNTMVRTKILKEYNITSGLTAPNNKTGDSWRKAYSFIYILGLSR